MEPMTAQWSPPRGTTNPDKALANYYRHLDIYTAEELDAGFQKLVANYMARSWPPVPECLKACSDIRERQRPRAKWESGVSDEWTDAPIGINQAREFMEFYGKLRKQRNDNENFEFRGLTCSPASMSRLHGLADAIYERHKTEYDRLIGDHHEST